MKKLLLVLMTCLFLLDPTVGRAASLTCDDQIGSMAWVYHIYLNGTPAVDSPAVKGINQELIRLLWACTDKVSLGVENSVYATLSDEYGATSPASAIYTFTPRLPLTPVAPQMIPAGGKRLLVTTATVIDTDNINGEVQYIVLLNGQTKAVNAVKVGDTTQRCELDISDIVVAGANTGSIRAKNGWGETATVPLDFNVTFPEAPTGLKFSVD